MIKTGVDIVFFNESYYTPIFHAIVKYDIRHPTDIY
jgi:hypothetical protein